MNLMIDSIRTAMAEQSALIGICVLAIFLASLILRKEVKSKWINIIFVACALWSIMIILAYPPRGTDYQIYTHTTPP